MGAPLPSGLWGESVHYAPLSMDPLCRIGPPALSAIKMFAPKSQEVMYSPEAGGHKRQCVGGRGGGR